MTADEMERQTKEYIKEAYFIGYRKGFRDAINKGGKTVYQEILDRALLPRHKGAGLYLEDEEDFLYIKRDGKILATFVSITVTYEIIHDACDTIINRE